MTKTKTPAPVEYGGRHHEQALTTLPHDWLSTRVVDYGTPLYRDVDRHRRHVRALDRHLGRWS